MMINKCKSTLLFDRSLGNNSQQLKKLLRELLTERCQKKFTSLDDYFGMLNCFIGLSRCSLGRYTIGSYYGDRESSVTNEQDGYSAFFKNGELQSFTLMFSEEYCKTQAFEGEIIYDKVLLNLDERTTPELIDSIFDALIDSWQDEVELNKTFLVGKCRLEFSWWIEGDSPRLNYLSVELEQKNSNNHTI